MNYEKLLAIFQAAAFELNPDGTFFYGIKEHQQQQRAEPMPQIQVDPFADQLNTGTALQAVRVFIGFLDQDTKDSSDLQQREIMFRMEKLSREFFGELSEHEDLPELVVNRNPLYRYSDAVLTGVVCDFTVNIAAELC